MPAIQLHPTANFTNPHIGARLRNLRIARGWSLTYTEKVSGVSKAMLGQIERGESNPTIALLWKIATAFSVSLSFFLYDSETRTVSDIGIARNRMSEEGQVDVSGMMVHTLIPYDSILQFELFSIELAVGGHSQSDAHAKGVIEHVTVLQGEISVQVLDEWHSLKAGETLRFDASVSHAYKNTGSIPAQVHNLIHHVSGTYSATSQPG